MESLGKLEQSQGTVREFAFQNLEDTLWDIIFLKLESFPFVIFSKRDKKFPFFAVSKGFVYRSFDRLAEKNLATQGPLYLCNVLALLDLGLSKGFLCNHPCPYTCCLSVVCL